MSERQTLPGDRLLQGGSAAIGICGIAITWIVLISTVYVARQTALMNARNETSNLAHTIEEQITREIKSVDQSLMFVRESYARSPADFDVKAWARSSAAVTDYAIQLSIMDRNGVLRSNSAVSDAKQLDMTDREHIRVQMTSDKDELFISRPVIGRVSHRWSIQFTRKLFDGTGAFDGVAVMSVDPGYLTRFYASIDLGTTGAVTLFGEDGIVRAAARSDDATETASSIGRQLSIEDVDRVATLNKAVIGPVDFDGIRRVTSYRKLRSYPLFVSVGRGEAEVLVEVERMRRTDSIAAIVLTAILVTATVALFLHQRRHAIAREKLRLNERLYAEKSLLMETALEHMGQGILMVDGDCRIQVCNRRAMTMLDLPEHLANKGTPFEDIIRYQWAQGEFSGATPPDPAVLDGIRGGGLLSAPRRYERQRPSGETLEITSMPLQDGGIVRTFTDISARKAFEAQLRTARDQADSATKAKSEFLAMMSHEIRSPMSGLIGALDLLRTTTLDADQAQMTNLAHGSALNLLAILNDILDFSKIEAGALTLSVEPVDIRGLVSELTRSHALVAQSKKVALTSSVAPDVPALILTDRLRLGQIITNLLSNAVKFTARGSISLTVTIDATGDRRRLRLDVVDSGLGMDQFTLQRLFQPFTQADGSSSRVAGGTGLGLCISRKLAHFLDGTLDVVSRSGSGSCFTLLMACNAHAEDAAPLQIAARPELDGALIGLKILVVDDNPTNRWLTQRQLTMLGAAVETASGGQAALDLLSHASFDAILTDCHMPGMDGVALASEARQRGVTFPIIGLTADVTPEQARRCRNAGIDDVLYKPASQARLAQVFGRLAPRPDTPAIVSALVFDDTTYRDLFEPGDPAAAQWLRSYCNAALEQIRTLCRLAQADRLDRSDLAARAHSLVGASLSAGALQAAQLVRYLEQAAPDQPPAVLARLADDAEREIYRATDTIELFLRDMVPALS